MTSTYNRNVLAAEIRKAMESRGLGAQDVADAIGVKAESIRKYLRGESRPEPHRIGPLETVLQIEPRGRLLVLAGYVGELPELEADPSYAGLDISDLSPENRARVEGFVEALRARRPD